MTLLLACKKVVDGGPSPTMTCWFVFCEIRRSHSWASPKNRVIGTGSSPVPNYPCSCGNGAPAITLPIAECYSIRWNLLKGVRWLCPGWSVTVQ